MPEATTSFDLVRDARAGGQTAFTRLFERYRRRLAVLIHYRLGPELRGTTEVDDLLQETMLRAFRDLEAFEYRGPGSFFGWLASIASRVLADAARYKARECRAGREVPFRSESNPLGPEPADTRTPSRVFAQEERLKSLISKLDALPPQYREAIVLAKIEGLTTSEMADRLGRTRESAALLLHRALRRFREETHE